MSGSALRGQNMALVPTLENVAISTTSVGSSAVVSAYGLRRLFMRGMSPLVSVRRSTDNATQTFYGVPGGGVLTVGPGGHGASLSSWLGGATGYVAQLWDQFGSNHLVPGNVVGLGTVPSIVMQGGSYSVAFSSNGPGLVLPRSGSFMDIPNATLNVYAGTLSSSPINAWGPFSQSTIAQQPTWAATGGGASGNAPMVITSYTGSGTYMSNTNAFMFPSFTGDGWSFATVYKVVSLSTGGWDRLLEVMCNGTELFAVSRYHISTTDIRFLYGNTFVGIPNLWIPGNWVQLIVNYTASTRQLKVYTSSGTSPSNTYTMTNSITADSSIVAGGMTFGCGPGTFNYGNVQIVSAMLTPYPLSSAQLVTCWSSLSAISNNTVYSFAARSANVTFWPTAPSTDGVTYGLLSGSSTASSSTTLRLIGGSNLPVGTSGAGTTYDMAYASSLASAATTLNGLPVSTDASVIVGAWNSLVVPTGPASDTVARFSGVGGSLNGFVSELVLFTSTVPASDGAVIANASSAASASAGAASMLAVQLGTQVVNGLFFQVFNGRYDEVPSWFDANSSLVVNSGYTANTTNLTTCTNGYYTVNGAANTSVQLTGYFFAATSGTYKFSLSSDDNSYLWIGPAALSGYTTANAVISNSGYHGVITKIGLYTMTVGMYYPVRIMFENAGGPCDLQFSYTQPSSSVQTYLGLGTYFSTAAPVALSVPTVALSPPTSLSTTTMSLETLFSGASTYALTSGGGMTASVSGSMLTVMPVYSGNVYAIAVSAVGPTGNTASTYVYVSDTFACFTGAFATPADSRWLANRGSVEVTAKNWYSAMALSNVSGAVASGTLSDPNVQYQLTYYGTLVTTNNFVLKKTIQNLARFSVYFEVYCAPDPNPADGIWFSFGGTGPPAHNYECFGAYMFNLMTWGGAYSGQGAYIMDGRDGLYAAANTSSASRSAWASSGTWVPMVLTYRNSTTNTVSVKMYTGGAWSDLVSYSNPNHATWLVAPTTGNCVTLGAHTGGLSQSLYVRRVELFTQSAFSIAPTSTATPSVLASAYKIATYPPTMTGSYTSTDSFGTYTASASSEVIPGLLVANGNGQLPSAWTVFNGALGTNYWTKWQCASSTYDETTLLALTNPAFFDGQVDSSYSGQWVMIQMPIPLYAVSYEVGGFIRSHRLYALQTTGQAWVVLDAQMRPDPIALSTISTFGVSQQQQVPYRYFVLKTDMASIATFGRTCVSWFRVNGSYAPPPALPPTLALSNGSFSLAPFKGSGALSCTVSPSLYAGAASFVSSASSPYVQGNCRNATYTVTANASSAAGTTTGAVTIVEPPPAIAIPPGCQGLYSLFLLSDAYAGPVAYLRRSSDNATSDFYSVDGQLRTNGSTPIVSWLSGSNAYVVTWYDQSGSKNNATMATAANQPSVDISTMSVSVGESYLSMPDGAIPYGNSKYTITIKHGSLASGINANLLVGGALGTLAGGGSDTVGISLWGGGGQYAHYWWANDQNVGVQATDNVVTFKYDQSNRYVYVNGALVGTMANSVERRSTPVSNYIGRPGATGRCGVYYIAIFADSLNDQSRLTVEGVLSTTAMLPILSYDAQTSVGIVNNCQGLFSLYRLSGGYAGPVAKLRRSSDNSTSDFYSVDKQLFTSAAGSTSVASWLGGATAYVATWYDQSGSGNNATMATAANQPSVNVSAMTVSIAHSQYLSLPNGATPYGNSKYTITAKHGTVSGSWATILGSGGYGAGEWLDTLALIVSNGRYQDCWWAKDFFSGAVAAGNVVTCKYDQTKRYMYVNGSLVDTLTNDPEVRRSTNVNNLIGSIPGLGLATPSQGTIELYYIAIVADALNDQSRLAVEGAWSATVASPTLSFSPVGTGIAISKWPNQVGSLGSSYVATAYNAPLVGVATSVYPPFSMTANTSTLGSGTYVASASSCIGAGEDRWMAFDNNNSTKWTAASALYNNGAYAGTATTLIGAVSYAGEWLQFQMPYPVTASSYSFRTVDVTACSPTAWAISGSIDGSTWYLLDARTGQTTAVLTTYTYAAMSSSSVLPFSYFRIVLTALPVAGGSWASLTEFHVNAVPAVAYPPFAMTANVCTQGQGVYVASASSSYPTDYIWYAFDNTTVLHWSSATVSYGVGGAYAGPVLTVVDGTAYAGEWLQFQMPYPVSATSYSFKTPHYNNHPGRCATSWVVAGSVDGSSWKLLDSKVGQVTSTSSAYAYAIVGANSPFSYFRIAITSITAQEYVSLTDFRVYAAPSPYHVGFVSASSQYFNITKPVVMDWFNNSGTYNGLTVFVVAQYTESAASRNFERFIDFGNGTLNANVLIDRVSTWANMSMSIKNAGTSPTTGDPLTEGNGAAIPPDGAFHIYVVNVKNTATSSSYAIYVDGTATVGHSQTSSISINNRTTTINYIGRSHWAGDAYLSANVRQIQMFNTSLSGPDMALAYRVLANKWDMFNDGSTPQRAAPNAAAIKALTGTAVDGYYWIGSGSTPTLTLCRMGSSPGVYPVTYSVRSTFASYTGPVMNLIRAADGAAADFYADGTQSAGELWTAFGNTGTSLTTWLNGANWAYVAKWYDQSGQGNHAVNATRATQPTLVRHCGRWVVRWRNSNSTVLNFTTPFMPFGVACQFLNTNWSGTFISTAIDHGLRLFYQSTTGGPNGGAGNNGDWYWSSGGTKLSYVDGAASTTVPLSKWNWMAVSTTSPYTSYGNFTRIGMDGFSNDRAIDGYMTEMILPSAAMQAADFTDMYVNRLKVNVASFPPAVMTADSTTFSASTTNGMSWTTDGGTYVASASSSYNATTASPSVAFNPGSGYSGGWTEAINNYSGTGGLYAGSVNTNASGVTYLGEWVQLQSPQPFFLTSYSITANNTNRSPKDFVLLGSQDGGLTWTTLDVRAGYAGYTARVPSAFSPNQTGGALGLAGAYSLFRLVVMRNNGADTWLSIYGLNFYGYPQTDALDSLPVTSGLVGAYTGDSWTGSRWTDISGAGNHVTTTTGTLAKTAVSTKCGKNYLYGGTSTSVEFPTAILPPTYTLFHLTRYNGASKARIFTGKELPTQNWLSGFYGLSGVCHHQNWLTSYGTSLFGSNWVLSTDQNDLYRGNMTNVTNGVPGTPSYAAPIGINQWASERSDWACACVFVYNRTLSSAEIANVEAWVNASYNNVIAYPTSAGYGQSYETSAPSAAAIKAITGTNTNGVYWINLPTIGPTQVYCVMDSAVDGGGWMLALKTASTGTTFQYSSAYWTNNTTLNPSDTATSNADAKYNTFNYAISTDMLVLWPGITSAAGGTLALPTASGHGWSWRVNGYSGVTPRTLLWMMQNQSNYAFPGWTPNAQNTTYPRFAEVGTATYNAFSQQAGNSFYGINFTRSEPSSVRIGVAFNNESDWNSNDVIGGVGMNSYQSTYFSAGDRYGCCGVAGINTQLMALVYVR